jgi:hypothetical protein
MMMRKKMAWATTFDYDWSLVSFEIEAIVVACHSFF